MVAVDAGDVFIGRAIRLAAGTARKQSGGALKKSSAARFEFVRKMTNKASS